MNVSTRERDIIKAIKESFDEFGWAPSQREIATSCGLASPASTNNNLKLLHAKGLIRFVPGSPRAISITETGMKALTEEV